MSQLQKDLIVVFGFSAENARRCEELFHNNELPSQYVSVVEHLYRYPWNRVNPNDMRPARYNMFNQLNYKLTTGEI